MIEKKCVLCEANLEGLNEPYLVEAAYGKNIYGEKGEVYSYALCFTCAHSMNKYVSEESRIYLENWNRELLQKVKDHPELDLIEGKKCVVRGTEIGDCEEYVIAKTFFNKEPMQGAPVLMISSAAMEEMQKNLSQQTKEFFEGFLDTYVDLPPDFKIKPVPII